ncbi:hypothetical protein PR202_gb24394 [Eleusine coracana subsp. coracana]|uniref:F-box domain-containing protein n=1 Tax=Eleusine coracana subsp. coracana TaxID=191504 RepID=A0AAV5FLH5_ELECO|nr:hypothetical protein PR202_gb24394 [Eleusine coracana subsp. coracana]
MPPEPQLAPGDWLSALPNGPLHTVLSFLPAPQAVRTCVLSRRWKDLWCTAPCINIDMMGGDFMRKWTKFEYFTTNLLLFRRGTLSLDKFRLCCSLTSQQCLRDVDRWVRLGIKYCPLVLEVILMGRIRIGPDSPFPHLGESSRLKRLHLEAVYLDRCFAEQIQSSCTVLEELELYTCVHKFQEISSRTLKTLIMETSENDSGQRFVITAPSLVYLQISVTNTSYSDGLLFLTLQNRTSPYHLVWMPRLLQRFHLATMDLYGGGWDDEVTNRRLAAMGRTAVVKLLRLEVRLWSAFVVRKCSNGQDSVEPPLMDAILRAQVLDFGCYFVVAGGDEEDMFDAIVAMMTPQELEAKKEEEEAAMRAVAGSQGGSLVTK